MEFGNIIVFKLKFELWKQYYIIFKSIYIKFVLYLD